MSDKTCGRCGAALPTELPHEGVRYRMLWGRQVTTYRLRFQRWKFKWMPEHADERARMFYSDLNLCDPCAGAVWLFATTKGKTA